MIFILPTDRQMFFVVLPVDQKINFVLSFYWLEDFKCVIICDHLLFYLIVKSFLFTSKWTLFMIGVLTNSEIHNQRPFLVINVTVWNNIDVKMHENFLKVDLNVFYLLIKRYGRQVQNMWVRMFLNVQYRNQVYTPYLKSLFRRNTSHLNLSIWVKRMYLLPTNWSTEAPFPSFIHVTKYFE